MMAFEAKVDEITDWLLQRQAQTKPQACGPIAQLDRVPDYESGGRGFESSSVRHHPVSPNLNKSQIAI